MASRRTEVLHFMRSQFVDFFPFMDSVLGAKSKNPLPSLGLQRLHMFFSNSFIVLCFTFKTMMDFELISV